jgi:hypothetical protein
MVNWGKWKSLSFLSRFRGGRIENYIETWRTAAGRTLNGSTATGRKYAGKMAFAIRVKLTKTSHEWNNAC